MKKIAFASLAVLAVFVASMEAMAIDPVSATQKFTVSVPSNISITPPAAASITHNESDSNQAFPNQSWLVKGNVLNGVSVSFATGSAFVHKTDSSFKRNAKLDLSVGSTQGPATWSVSTASDTTDYANNDGVATVVASSTGVGRANMNLLVTFITDTFGTFAAGDYEMTVTGTVSSN